MGYPYLSVGSLCPSCSEVALAMGSPALAPTPTHTLCITLLPRPSPPVRSPCPLPDALSLALHCQAEGEPLDLLDELTGGTPALASAFMSPALHGSSFSLPPHHRHHGSLLAGSASAGPAFGCECEECATVVKEVIKEVGGACRTRKLG